jgi:dipeptidyl aminopeptidase/acylaminoacyl peptidase
MNNGPSSPQAPNSCGHFRSAVVAAIGASASLACAEGEPGAKPQERYRTPSAEVVRILDAEPLPFVDVSPTGSHMLLMRRENLPPISELAQPMLRLAGRRINPDLNAPHGPRSVVGITIVEIGTGDETKVELPEGAGVSMQEWSPAGDAFLFTVTGPDGVALWIADVRTGEVRALTPPTINALGPGACFLPGGREVIAAMIPPERGPAPARSAVPTGPIVQENRAGGAAPVRTYQDLLQDAHDEALFEHHFTSQLVRIPLASTQAPDSAGWQALGAAAMLLSVDPSPTGAHLLVQRIEPPLVRHVQMGEFARAVEVWRPDGEVLRVVARLPVADRVPTGGVLTGPRGHRWRDTVGTDELLWVEALDEGHPRNEVEHRDRLMLAGAPFHGPPRELLRTAGRLSGVTWLGDGAHALVRDYERRTRWETATLIDIADPDSEPRKIFSRGALDSYADPGSPLMMRNGAGRRVARFVDGRLFLAGLGASPEGNRPFLDRFDPATGATERLWQNLDESYERVVDLVGGDASVLITRRETPTEPPNYQLLELATGARRALTEFKHPAPQLKDVKRELVRYRRDDGVELSAMLYLPPGHEEGRRWPLVVWAYPREFNDAETASQVTDSPFEFTMFGGPSHLFLLLEGYAILDRAAMPVVGSDPETVNDTFIEQIVASAKAAIDHAEAIGVGDRSRVGIGGHSYGAFMTANLLAHSELFKAGIARSGAFNRTLTPFGFQAERRSLWEAPEVYISLSPFMHADAIKEPLLLIHGEVDNNPGTFPMQSERLYHAIVGHGGTARLVMLPHESHGYRARESVLHVLAETIAWFNEFVRDASDPQQ